MSTIQIRIDIRTVEVYRICRSMFRFLNPLGRNDLPETPKFLKISGFLVAECVGNPRTQ